MLLYPVSNVVLVQVNAKRVRLVHNIFTRQLYLCAWWGIYIYIQYIKSNTKR